jgi:hypothetical protein
MTLESGLVATGALRFHRFQRSLELERGRVREGRRSERAMLVASAPIPCSEWGGIP